MKHICQIKRLAMLLALSSVASQACAETIEVMAMPNFSFQPRTIRIEAGDAVHWTGLAEGFHTVAEVDTGSFLAYNGVGFHSEPLASELMFVFLDPGVYYYVCEPHVAALGMRGVVIVTPFLEQVEFGIGPTIPIAWGDYDNDDDLDLAVGNQGGENQLFVNNGDGSFTETQNLGDGSTATFALVWGDYDNDGDLDVAVGNTGPNLLFVNQGDGTFVEESAFGGGPNHRTCVGGLR